MEILVLKTLMKILTVFYHYLETKLYCNAGLNEIKNEKKYLTFADVLVLSRDIWTIKLEEGCVIIWTKVPIKISCAF